MRKYRLTLAFAATAIVVMAVSVLVAYFISESNVRSLVTQMGSIGLDVRAHLREDKFRIHPIQEPTTEESAGSLKNLVEAMESLPHQCKVIVVDSITNLASYSQDSSIIGFFSSCKRICGDGKTILLVPHSYAFNEQMLIRLRSLRDAHLSLRVENVGAKLVKMLEVHKVHNADQITGNIASFDVEPGIGMRVVPIRKAQV